MAEAARLSARMQKELKLLLTDRSTTGNEHSSSSLTSIDRCTPQQTVYSNGLRSGSKYLNYLFQPPVVTFATYLPSKYRQWGRICLDILNLPPKAVLISIGLLLSGPNPDDGLMHEEVRWKSSARECALRFKGSDSKLWLECVQSSSNSNSETKIFQVPGELKKEDNSGSAKYNENPGKSVAKRNKMSLISCFR
ncbi:hypothetical protein CASFOL_010439 [Castilleja foliolosa]|uniref:Uncharacterized protein n=1 Tax=Castilleja foliolosa TaxID=1961234 RepID=A0ABD3DWD9_9LAMI